MPRLLFEKSGAAVWISHLDLMRLFQRAFKRAGFSLKHTQGFNPRPSVSIALPLSVGVESKCELLDFDLDGDLASGIDICDRLNAALIPGVKAVEAYHTGRKLRDLAYLKCKIIMEYDLGVPARSGEAISQLLSCESLLVPKRTKNGIQDQDIIPMIRSFSITRQDANSLCLEAVICCQNPTLNPVQIMNAIQRDIPEHYPDHYKIIRYEIYDHQEGIFR